MSQVQAFNRKGEILLLDTGETVPITNWLDDDGDECPKEEAVAVVAGPDASSKWYAADLATFEPVTVN
jgi:hypothetical protein